eukprot:67939-Rhodomonas_salina.1
MVTGCHDSTDASARELGRPAKARFPGGPYGLELGPSSVVELMTSHNTLSDTCHLEFAGLGGGVAYGFAVLHPRVLWENPKRAQDVAKAADGVARVQESK